MAPNLGPCPAVLLLVESDIWALSCCTAYHGFTRIVKKWCTGEASDLGDQQVQSLSTEMQRTDMIADLECGASRSGCNDARQLNISPLGSLESASWVP